MARICLLLTVVATATALAAGVQARGDQAGRRGAAPTRLSRTVTCKADLGTGMKTKRQYCDVLIADTPAASVTMPIPAHTGTAMLMFDLHPRMPAPTGEVDPAQAFERDTALVAIIRPAGGLIERAVVIREFRTLDDLFDRITGVKAVAPGQPESIRVTIPAGVASIGIVGVRLEVVRRAPRPEVFDSAGRPVAIVSNMRIEYTAR